MSSPRLSFRRLRAGLVMGGLLLAAACGNNGTKLVSVAETDEAKYQYGEQMLRETRPDDALAAFLEVIKARPDDAPESHLEAGRILLGVKNDPVEAIHHFREYLAAKPNSEQAPMVRQLIETAEKQFARALPGNKDAYDEVDLLDQINALKTENANLRSQLAGAPVRITGNTLQNNSAGDSPTPAVVRVAPPPSVTRTSPPPPVSPVAVTVAPAPRTYTVQAGDTLSNISFKIYGVRNRYLEIYNANTDQLASPNAMLHIGQVLKLPQ